jgi:hypothetical protein
MKTAVLARLAALAAATALVPGACTDGTGLQYGAAEVRVTLQQATDAIAAQVVAGPELAPDDAAGRVPRENVVSLTVTVTGVAILPQCEEAGEGSGDGQCEDLWIPLDLVLEDGVTGVTLNLMELPSEDASPILLAAADVPEGEYHKVRLFISDAFVVFAEEFTVGQSVFLPGDPIEVEIPSSQNSGIKADIDLVVGEGNVEDVALLFDADATFRHVVGTGSGRVLMPPVLKARPMNQNHNQNG